ncbi:MAG: hypothetical protein PF450_05745 [Bacteroidales bacterium]|nr:hypothetical protein [Bacteroidales bacterium]
MKKLSDKLSERGLEAILTGMGKVNTYMPPFVGTYDERKALANYIYTVIQEKETPDELAFDPGEWETEVPTFNADDDYVLLAWNDLGMHCISDNEKYFSFLPPANTFNAQLFKRGAKPEVVTSNVIITYEPEPGYENPQNHSLFWEYDEEIFGVDLPIGKGLAGKEGVLNFSTAIHGFHANYFPEMDDEACNMCHPSREDGNTVCFRGRHSSQGLTCTSCHGMLEDHALGLLATQKGIAAAERLAKNLDPVFVADKQSIVPRQPWLMEPDCKSCHTSFSIQTDGYTGTSYNMWVPGFNALYRNRTDDQGVMCSACHGSTHAVYGAQNKYELQRDNLQPLQYQGLGGTIGTHNSCVVCHKKSMNTNGHHRNMVNRENIVALVN